MNTLVKQIKPKQLFMIDSAGALLSAFLLGYVLVKLEHIFGMPPAVLYPLAAIALVFCGYSLICCLALKENPQPFLRLIAICNLLYCLLTIILMVYHHNELTVWGYMYFVSELAIVSILAFIELSVARRG